MILKNLIDKLLQVINNFINQQGRYQTLSSGYGELHSPSISEVYFALPVCLFLVTILGTVRKC